MDLSRNWLHEFVDLRGVSDKEFDSAMTLSGSKVELTTRLDAEIKNVVVGRVVDIVRHQNSDHMWICQVDIGAGDPVQIVTGAQNVQKGDLVPVAKHKSLLPGGVKIEKGKLRGEVSNGMLCSLAELNLDTHDFPDAIEDGIFILNNEDCTVGQDINEVIGTNDSVVEFEITNNRPDCYSIIGLAREASATFRKPLNLHDPVVKGCGETLFDRVDVDTPDPDLCPRYTARMVRNVKIGPSPKWMRQRLRAAGVRPINNIVDITNYVMLEYGQPMHAFDYRYISGGKIIVRRAVEGEVLTTLDGVERKLKPGMLVIADEKHAIGLAGIMGGENSEIVDDTVDVVFESANFNGTSIRQTALALGMRTDASAKNEKGLDPMLTLPAVNRACELVEQLGAGEVLDGVIDILNHVEPEKTIELEPERVNRLLGTDIPLEQMQETFRWLGFGVDGTTLTIPSWRPDIAHMADLAEEVGRFYGYDNIPTTLMRGETTQGGRPQVQLDQMTAGTAARAMGYNEIITYSFDSPNMFDLIRLPQDSDKRNCIHIINPLGEDTSVMRTTALPSMLTTLSRNYAYRNKTAKLYELARIYLPVEGQKLPDEPVMLMLGTYGANETFFTMKGEIDAILRAVNAQPATYEAVSDNPSYHPGRCASVTVGGKLIGVFGQIHPLVAQNYGINDEVYCAEINFTLLRTVLAPEATYHPLPKYPTISRDLALVCEESTTVAALEAAIQKAAGALLREIDLFDIYRGAPIAAGKKSMAFTLLFRADDRTLTDDEVDADITAILNALRDEHGISLR
jgi:phenylalanyl-tRNA synthetase beta chain